MAKAIKRTILVIILEAILISFFVLTARAETVTLKWDANSVAPEGYRVFQRLDKTEYNYGFPVCDTKETSCAIDNLEQAVQYYFVARAYIGEEMSGDSNEIGYKPGIEIPKNLAIDVKVTVTVNGKAVTIDEGL